MGLSICEYRVINFVYMLGSFYIVKFLTNYKEKSLLLNNQQEIRANNVQRSSETKRQITALRTCAFLCMLKKYPQKNSFGCMHFFHTNGKSPCFSLKRNTRRIDILDCWFYWRRRLYNLYSYSKWSWFEIDCCTSRPYSTFEIASLFWFWFCV